MNKLKISLLSVFLLFLQVVSSNTYAANNTQNDQEYLDQLLANTNNYLQNEEYLKCLSNLQKIETLVGPQCGFSFFLGLTSERLNWYANAINYLEEASLCADKSESLYMLGYMYTLIGENKKALDCYNTYLSVYEPNARILNSKADLYLKEGKFDEAMPLLEEGSEINPDYAVLWGTMGEVYRYKGDSDKAIYYFDKVLELDPTISPANMLKIEELKKQGKSKEDYKGLCETIITKESAILAKNPQTYESLYYRAYGYSALGDQKKMQADIDNALPIMDKLIGLHPNAYPIMIFRANLYDLQGDSSKAKQEFEKVLKINPSNPDALSYLKRNC